MSRWDPLPPSRFQRWIARHAVALQIAFACLAAASAVLAVTAVRSDGLGQSSVSPILNVVVFLLLIWTPRGVARHVANYDRRQETGRH